ncbi:hypothetical protein BpHYR1_011879 [Brachionus plicatilis]|uniref:Uncharacterized protein n=1 Tax=Brachionus plicatilis TaxID=10195 RepID=A0A3M7RQG7_BRAPC|nr:hypothetical protein BpHYR1_011879 [Brachionus plicatilis]
MFFNGLIMVSLQKDTVGNTKFVSREILITVSTSCFENLTKSLTRKEAHAVNAAKKQISQNVLTGFVSEIFISGIPCNLLLDKRKKFNTYNIFLLFYLNYFYRGIGNECTHNLLFSSISLHPSEEEEEEEEEERNR